MSDVLFPGCTVQSRLPFIESAFVYILKELGKDAEYLTGATCCMEPVGLRSMDQNAWLSVNKRLHSIAGGNRIVTLCEGCNLSLSESSDIISESNSTDVSTNTISEVSGSLQFLYDDLDEIRKRITSPLKMRLAVFPGCHCEYVCSKEGRSAVKMMEEVIKAIGAEPVMPLGDLCCGGGMSMIAPDVDRNVLNETISSFKDIGADAAAVACPFCFLRFDMAAKFRTYHLVELVAMSMGYPDTIGYHISKQVH